MALFLMLACATTSTYVRSVEQVSPGGGPREFYVVVKKTTYPPYSTVPSDIDSIILRCQSVERSEAWETTCLPVLYGDNAIKASQKPGPSTFVIEKPKE